MVSDSHYTLKGNFLLFPLLDITFLNSLHLHNPLGRCGPQKDLKTLTQISFPFH